MPFADFLSGPGVILLGMAMLAIAFVLRRSGVKRAAASAKRDLVAEVREHFEAADKADRSQLAQLTLRLHDYGREIDALAETRIATLRQLIRQADATIAELRTSLPGDPPASEDDDSTESNAAA